MSISHTAGLVAGHYECRSLSETLPIFTDLLAMEIVEQKAGEATLKHPNTDWLDSINGKASFIFSDLDKNWWELS